MSRETPTVIASKAKQSRTVGLNVPLDCFVAALLAMTGRAVA